MRIIKSSTFAGPKTVVFEDTGDELQCRDSEKEEGAVCIIQKSNEHIVGIELSAQDMRALMDQLNLMENHVDYRKVECHEDVLDNGFAEAKQRHGELSNTGLDLHFHGSVTQDAIDSGEMELCDDECEDYTD